MILTVDSDAAYLVLPKGRGRNMGYSELLNNPSNTQQHMYNESILIECQTLRDVVSLGTEAKTNEVFQNVQLAVSLKCYTTYDNN